MNTEIINLGTKKATGYVIPLGPANLVFAKTNTGMIACGAIDVFALDRFNYPAARIKPKGDRVKDVNDLLEGVVKDSNETAKQLGVEVGMIGQDALEKM